MKSRRFKIIFFTVLVTLVAVLLFANLRNPQKELAYKIESAAAIDSPHFSKVLGDVLGPALVSGNQVQAFYNGDEIFPAMLEAIHGAQKTVTFESYIYWSGKIGDKFSEALTERASAGVRVHVLMDWMGSDRLEDKQIEKMEKAGVEVERYNAPRWYNVSRMEVRKYKGGFISLLLSPSSLWPWLIQDSQLFNPHTIT